MAFSFGALQLGLGRITEHGGNGCWFRYSPAVPQRFNHGVRTACCHVLLEGIKVLPIEGDCGSLGCCDAGWVEGFPLQ